MQYVYVGGHPRHLASGRPLVFGDVVDASDLHADDEGDLDLWLVPNEPVEASVPAAPVPEAKPPTTTSEDA